MFYRVRAPWGSTSKVNLRVWELDVPAGQPVCDGRPRGSPQGGGRLMVTLMWRWPSHGHLNVTLNYIFSPQRGVEISGNFITVTSTWRNMSAEHLIDTSICLWSESCLFQFSSENIPPSSGIHRPVHVCHDLTRKFGWWSKDQNPSARWLQVIANR